MSERIDVNDPTREQPCGDCNGTGRVKCEWSDPRTIHRNGAEKPAQHRGCADCPLAEEDENGDEVLPCDDNETLPCPECGGAA